MTTFLAILSLAMLCMLVRERRVARRRHGALLCEHRQAMARHGIERFREGMMDERERWQKKQEAQATL